MHYGLELPCGGDDITAALLVELGVRAEAAGWDGVFFEDYLVYYRGVDPPTFDPWIVLTAISGRTSTVQLGTTVTGLLVRDPVKLAREAMTLGHLSGGRVVLGVGLGDPADRGVHLAPAPDDHLSRGDAMDQRLDLLLKLLSGDPAPASEAATAVTFRPRKARPDEVRVWIGGSAQARAVARRAARADGIVPYKLTDAREWSDFTTAEIGELVATITAQRASNAGPLDVAIGGRRRLEDLDAERNAVQAARDGGATWWLEFVPPAPGEQMLALVDAGPIRAA
jgi:alkanesulfonate monooxygenase SsuD/methylene tetrahydromethanopterin reductase-like flavin-dependent oxidoreductase (luciferase family)